jgi:predicted nucleotidyltransferase component of viral defense system
MLPSLPFVSSACHHYAFHHHTAAVTTHQSLPMVSVKGICTKKLLMVLQKGQGKAAFFRDLQGERGTRAG